MGKFSPIFSGGAPGAALLLMRIATAATLLLGALQYMTLHGWQGFAAIIPAISLLAGLCTRAAGAISALLLGMLAALTAAPAGALLALLGIQAFALALLGPGAYSVDARLFGRRVIRLDDESDTSG